MVQFLKGICYYLNLKSTTETNVAVNIVNKQRLKKESIRMICVIITICQVEPQVIHLQQLYDDKVVI